jgi:phage terminase large subunit
MTALRIETPRVFKPLLKPARYKGIHGGRGSGKSHVFAENLIEFCLEVPGTRWACIREVQRSLNQSVKRLVEDKIQKFGVGHLFEVQDKRIKTPGDGVIVFEGMQNHTADSIKSFEGFHGAWVEEASSLSQRSLTLLRPTIRKEFEYNGKLRPSELWFSWNPDLPTDPVDAFFRGESPPPDSVIIEANYFDNPWFPDVLRMEMEYDKRRDPDKYAHVWLGQYRKNTEARVFKNWRIEEFEAPDGSIFRQGADWGFAVDPSVLIRARIEGKNLYIDYEAYAVGREIDFLPDLFDSVPDARKWPITADSARPETISYMQRHGFPKIQPAIKGPKSIEEGIEFLLSYDIIVHPRCTHTIDELTLYSYKIDPLTQEVLPILEDKHNHVIDALRYACEAARRATKPEAKPRKPPTHRIGGWMN